MPEIHVISHCFLNPGVRLPGLRPLPLLDCPGTIQLPCPEAVYFGLNRWEVTVEQLDIPSYRRFCRRLFQNTADTIQMLFRAGYTIKLIGVGGSPSCGIRSTSTGFSGGRLRAAHHSHIPGRGIFMDEIIRELENRDIAFETDEK